MTILTCRPKSWICGGKLAFSTDSISNKSVPLTWRELSTTICNASGQQQNNTQLVISYLDVTYAVNCYLYFNTNLPAKTHWHILYSSALEGRLHLVASASNRLDLPRNGANRLTITLPIYNNFKQSKQSLSWRSLYISDCLDSMYLLTKNWSVWVVLVVSYHEYAPPLLG